jgi:hypothetical protein
MDSIYDVVKDAQVNHYKRWQILGVRTGAPEVEAPAQTWDEEVQRLRDWIRIRLEWLDENLPGSHDNCLTYTKEMQENNSPSLRIFPNPATSRFYVETSWAIHAIEMFDISGRKVLTLRPNGLFSVEIPATALENGLYLLKISYINGETSMGKILIR